MARSALLLGVLFAAGCSQPTWIREGYVARFEKSPAAFSPDDPALQVQWLGVGGFLVTLGEHAVLFPPLYSNQTIGQVGFQPIRVNTKRIDREMPPCDKVEAILIPHAHYDHILDVPHIMKRHATASTAYGSRTAMNILAGFDLPGERIREAPRKTWIYTKSRRIRFSTFQGSHAPHLAGVVHLWNGTVEKPLSKPPRYAREYQKGANLNYLVEFLDGNEQPLYTFFYQDGVASGITGLPTIEHRRVDLLLLTVPGWDQVEDYPRPSLERFHPGEIVFSHFDEFLQEPEEGLQLLRNCDLDGFLLRVQEILESESIPATITIPTPGARMRFPLPRP